MKKALIASALAMSLGAATQAAGSAGTATNGVAPSATAATSTLNPSMRSSPPRRFGVGFIIGEPTGASLKYWLNNTLAVDGAFGWSWHNDTDFYLHGDVLWHNFTLLRVARGELPVYFGVGALARFRSEHHDNEVGLRVPVGISYMFPNAPMDIFAEVAPDLIIAPTVRGGVTGGIGVRYWF